MKTQNNQQGVITDASQNNQQGVITDASQNNQQGVITGQNKINKFLSVQEPVGESVVRFKENFAVPLSPSNPYYSLFFHPSFDGFQESIANETDSQRRFEELMESEVSKIENIQAQQMRVKNISTADKKLAKSIADIDQEKNNIITNAETRKNNAITTAGGIYSDKIDAAEQILNSAKEKKETEFQPNNFFASMSTQKERKRIGWPSVSSEYFTKQDKGQLEQELKEIVAYHKDNSLGGLKINTRVFCKATTQDGNPMKLKPGEYIQKIEYTSGQYYNYSRYGNKYPVLHYVNFITNMGQSLKGGSRRSDYIKTLDDIRLLHIVQGNYTGNRIVNLTLDYIPNYNKQLAELKEDFISNQMTNDQTQFNTAKNNAETQRKQECDVAVERYNEAISQAIKQKEEKYSLVKEQHTTDKKLAEDQFVKDCAVSDQQALLFLSQTTAVVLDERINVWYRRYQQITDKEQHFRGLVDAYKYELDSRNKERFAESVVLDEGSYNTQYTKEYLDEVFSKTQGKNDTSEDSVADDTTVDDTTATQVVVSKSLFKLEAEYTQYRNILYQIRDMKSELLREIRLAGYNLTEIDSDVTVGKKIQELGYHFVITKGEPEYKDIVMADYKTIFQNIGIKESDNPVVYNILVKNKAPKKLSEDELNSLKGFFENEGQWEKTIKELNDAFKGMPQELKQKFIAQKNRLKKDSDEKIPHSLWAEKQTEKSLEESQNQNLINNESWLAERKAKKEQLELDSSKGFPNAKKVLENLLEQVKNIQHYNRYAFKYSHEEKTDKILQNLHWEAVDTFFDLFQKSCDSDGALVVGGDKKTSLKFEFYSGQGMNKTVNRVVSNWGGTLWGYSNSTVSTTYDLAEPFLYIRILNEVPDTVKEKWGSGEDYIFVIKKGNGFTVKSGSWDGETKNNIESSHRYNAIKVFYDFFESCQTLCELMSKWSAEEKNRLNEVETVYAKQKEINDKALENIQKYALTKARLQFLIKWKSPGRFGGYMKISNPIMPDTDPWVEFVDQLKAQDGAKEPGKYNPMSRKVKIDHFSFSRNGYYTQDGLSMQAYLQFIAGDDRSKAMRVAIFPVLDREGSTIPNLRRAVINPERSFETNPIKTLPRVRFIEQNKTTIIWDGMCLGELSHTENLTPGESKTITIEKQTRLKEKLSSSFENEIVATAKDSVSFEEKLSQEVNNEETSEEEIMRESEEKQEKERKEKDTKLAESKDSTTSTVTAEAGANYGAASGKVSGSKTNTSSSLNRQTQENENAVKDSKKLTERKSSKQGKKSQQKNLSEKINKTASETSKTNKTNVKKTSEQESESMDKRLETIEISNQNVGKTLNYYFFQLQNIYKTITETENVKIVINPGHEIIAKSALSDVRVFDIADFGDIFEEIGGATNDQNALICGLIMHYIQEHYHIPKTNQENTMGISPYIPYKNMQEVLVDLIKNPEVKDPEGEVNEIIDGLKKRIKSFYEDLKESDLIFDFHPIQINKQEVAVNSGGLYLDVEVGKKMATEPYLENRRDIETHLQNTKVKQLEAEVKHLEAQTQAGIFFPPPQNTPVQISPTANNKAAATFSSFPQDTTSTTSANRESSGNNKKDQSNSSSSESAGDSADEEEADRKGITTDKSDDKLESDNKSSNQIASAPSKPLQKPKKKSWLARLWQKITGSS